MKREDESKGEGRSSPHSSLFMPVAALWLAATLATFVGLQAGLVKEVGIVARHLGANGVLVIRSLAVAPLWLLFRTLPVSWAKPTGAFLSLVLAAEAIWDSLVVIHEQAWVNGMGNA